LEIRSRNIGTVLECTSVREIIEVIKDILRRKGSKCTNIGIKKESQ
jgi:hypothetical protein